MEGQCPHSPIILFFKSSQMKQFLWFSVLLCSITAFSCKELYTPELEDIPEAIVIEGLITDEYKTHVISVTKAVNYDTIATFPEKGAKVFITDNLGNSFYFKELTAGKYYSDSATFKPKIGSTYFLTVVTKNNNVYKSAEQKLLPKGTQEEISSIPQKLKYNLTIDGKAQFLDLKGSHFQTVFRLQSETEPYYRFSNYLLVEYIARSSDPPISYCWKKYNLNDFFNINDRQYNSSLEFQHDLGFCPFDLNFYGVVRREVSIPGCPMCVRIINNDLYKYIISFKQYHINNDTYKYYKSLNRQLAASQQIFDPISFQSYGNITCVNDSNKIVLGFFETSSVNINTYIVEPSISGNNYTLNKISPIDFDSISQEGYNDLAPPKSWIY